MKKHLAILIYSLASGGAERVVSVLLPELIKDYHITLVLMNSKIFYNIPKEVNIFYLEKSKADESGIKKLLKLPILAWKYRNFCYKNGIEISLSLMSRPNYINILAKIFGNRAKTIISERSMPSLQYGYKALSSKLNRWLISYLYPKADAIIANSFGNRADLISNFKIPKEKIRVIYNPFDFEYIASKAKEPLKNWRKRAFTYVTIGRLDEGKNHTLLIKALAKMNRRDVELIIIGDGELRSNLEELVDSLDLKGEVKLVGRQKNPFSWIANSDCFIFGSNHEGFPNVLIEALACNTPIISTDCLSGPREILNFDTSYNEQIEDIKVAKFGILVPVNDIDMMSLAMEKVYNDDNLRKELSKSAICSNQRFRKDKIVKEWIKILEDS